MWYVAKHGCDQYLVDRRVERFIKRADDVDSSCQRDVDVESVDEARIVIAIPTSTPGGASNPTVNPIVSVDEFDTARWARIPYFVRVELLDRERVMVDGAFAEPPLLPWRCTSEYNAAIRDLALHFASTPKRPDQALGDLTIASPAWVCSAADSARWAAIPYFVRLELLDRECRLFVAGTSELRAYRVPLVPWRYIGALASRRSPIPVALMEIDGNLVGGMLISGRWFPPCPQGPAPGPPCGRLFCG